jgi:hypothetical protein
VAALRTGSGAGIGMGETSWKILVTLSILALVAARLRMRTKPRASSGRWSIAGSAWAKAVERERRAARRIERRRECMVGDPMGCGSSDS